MYMGYSRTWHEEGPRTGEECVPRAGSEGVSQRARAGQFHVALLFYLLLLFSMYFIF